ncbi:UDP-glucose 6-dehydrogenase, partial [hydrothermal vent metagenome]
NAYRGLDMNEVKKRMKGNAFIDLRNVYEPETMKEAGFEYVCIGRN